MGKAELEASLRDRAVSRILRIDLDRLLKLRRTVEWMGIRQQQQMERKLVDFTMVEIAMGGMVHESFRASNSDTAEELPH